MIRNPKDFGVWAACPSGVHSLITELGMLPLLNPFLPSEAAGSLPESPSPPDRG